MDVIIHKGIVDDSIRKEIPESQWCGNLIQYASYKCKMDGMIAAAALFCPEIIEVQGHYFIKAFWNCDSEEASVNCLDDLKKRFGSDKSSIERWVNAWSLGSFFEGEHSEIMNNDVLLDKFGEILRYFWKQRLKELFPDKHFTVELGEEICGEWGASITMYETA